MYLGKFIYNKAVSVHQNVLMHPSYLSSYYISRDAFTFLRQVRAIAGRAQQVAKPSASFRIFITSLLSKQDTFLRKIRQKEREREKERLQNQIQ